MDDKCRKDSAILKAFEAIQTENQKLQNTLQDIVLARKSVEASLNTVEKNLTSFFQEEQNLQAIHAINLMKIQNVEGEVLQMEEKQKALTENIRDVDEKVKKYKENLETEINNFTKATEHLCELFLSAVHKETAESECSKVWEEINKVKQEIGKREEALLRVRKEVEEEFAALEASPEFQVTPEEREALMEALESQYVSASSQMDDLQRMKSEKVLQEYQRLQKE